MNAVYAELGKHFEGDVVRDIETLMNVELEAAKAEFRSTYNRLSYELKEARREWEKKQRDIRNKWLVLHDARNKLSVLIAEQTEKAA